MALTAESPSASPARETVIFSMLGLVWLAIAGLVSLDTGVNGVALFTLGTALGTIFLLFQYGFASGWRNFILNGDMMPLAAHFLLAALCAVVFIPAKTWGLSASGSLAPVSVSLFIGAFAFGIGMQLANGCGSGVLFSFGGGSGRMLVALPFFVIGSVIGSIILPSVLAWGQLAPIQIAGTLPEQLRMLVNLALLGGTSFSFWWIGRKRGQSFPRRLLRASTLIAILCWGVFALSGHPWGVTFGFTLWGAKLAGFLGIDIGGFTFWQWPGPARALSHSVLADTSSLMDIGMLIGAGLWAAFSGALQGQAWPNRTQLVAAAIGGLLMGIGARLAFGCNIGAFLAGTASGSLHGWIWFLMALGGSWVGIRLRPVFGFGKQA
jgi:uncharacterized membrane protein YedE/YeeE